MSDVEMEYALRVVWDELTVEYIPAQSPGHAAEMAAKLYRGQATLVVERPARQWRKAKR